MAKEIFIYLSGSIKKSNAEDRGYYWSLEDIAFMRQEFKNYDIEPVFLNPAQRSDDLSDPQSVFGRDILQVYLSELCNIT